MTNANMINEDGTLTAIILGQKYSYEFLNPGTGLWYEGVGEAKPGDDTSYILGNVKFNLYEPNDHIKNIKLII